MYISWNDHEIMENQFKQYMIQVSKLYTRVDAQTPLKFTTTISNYNITGLEAAVDYQISVNVDTVDFGQSAWSDSITALTKALQPSDSSDVAQLKKQMVRCILISFPSVVQLDFTNFLFLSRLLGASGSL